MYHGTENRALKRKRSSSRGKASSVTSGSRSNDSVSVPPSKPWGAPELLTSFTETLHGLREIILF